MVVRFNTARILGTSALIRFHQWPEPAAHGPANPLNTKLARLGREIFPSQLIIAAGINTREALFIDLRKKGGRRRLGKLWKGDPSCQAFRNTTIGEN